MTKNNFSLVCVLCYGTALCAVLFCALIFGGEFFSLSEHYYKANTKGAAVKTLKVPSDNGNMQLRKVRFALDAPKAKEVFLHADFNLWGIHKIKLEREDDGSFATMLVLPQGDYKYYFICDGKPVLDTRNREKVNHMGKEVSARTVL